MTTTNQVERPTGPPRSSGAWLGRAWGWVVSIPVFFFVSFALGYVLYDLFGYRPENNDAPLWVDLVVSLLSVAVVLIPCVAAVICGRRAHRAGDRRGLLPLAVGALAGLGLTTLTVVTVVADALR